MELQRPPSDSAFRYYFRQVDLAALCAAIRDWTIAQILDGAADLDQLVWDGKTLQGSSEPTANCGSAFIYCPGNEVIGSSRSLLKTTARSTFSQAKADFLVFSVLCAAQTAG